MKLIAYQDDIKDVMGFPFILPDPNPKMQMEALKVAREQGKATYERPTIEGTFSDVIAWFLNGLPWVKDDKGQPLHKLTYEEQHRAGKVIAAFKTHPEGYVELDELDCKALCDWVASAEGAEAFKASVFVIEQLLNQSSVLVIEQLAMVTDGVKAL